MQYSNLANSAGQTIYIDTLELPNVQNANDFVNALKQLPGLANSEATKRT